MYITKFGRSPRNKRTVLYCVVIARKWITYIESREKSERAFSRSVYAWYSVFRYCCCYYVVCLKTISRARMLSYEYFVLRREKYNRILLFFFIFRLKEYERKKNNAKLHAEKRKEIVRRSLSPLPLLNIHQTLVDLVCSELSTNLFYCPVERPINRTEVYFLKKKVCDQKYTVQTENRIQSSKNWFVIHSVSFHWKCPFNKWIRRIVLWIVFFL